MDGSSTPLASMSLDDLSCSSFARSISSAASASSMAFDASASTSAWANFDSISSVPSGTSAIESSPVVWARGAVRARRAPPPRSAAAT
eukprot:CAMPEP_0175703972 /NCGR_PEP_ID=MMETSP0097-20121207/36788_1 /TAXON_ID=311494 /ORGANISM="Alexandrium monilatum, Strain CCMP3105" /LENGTH=87 /DNA_ID=CAMNT_0017011269 /DNA_START=23 /DNA_END=283 /DNA_ORIENTATION=-